MVLRHTSILSLCGRVDLQKKKVFSRTFHVFSTLAIFLFFFFSEMVRTKFIKDGHLSFFSLSFFAFRKDVHINKGYICYILCTYKCIIQAKEGEGEGLSIIPNNFIIVLLGVWFTNLQLS